VTSSPKLKESAVFRHTLHFLPLIAPSHATRVTESSSTPRRLRVFRLALCLFSNSAPAPSCSASVATPKLVPDETIPSGHVLTIGPRSPHHGVRGFVGEICWRVCVADLLAWVEASNADPSGKAMGKWKLISPNLECDKFCMGDGTRSSGICALCFHLSFRSLGLLKDL
jgi:hypothetical protein